MIDRSLTYNDKGEYWYAVQREADEEWDTGSDRWEEAVKMCYDQDYKYIAVIQCAWYIDGELITNTNPVCLDAYERGVDFDEQCIRG